MASLSLDVIAHNMGSYVDLGFLPLDVVVHLLSRVLELGLLTPHSLELFKRTGHPELNSVLMKLASGMVPPILPTRCGPRS